ncbi:phosphoserine phosphatase SerB [Neisseria weixii]|uniref:Phosphoserine phosphatase n=1 Tax=Neisseria weixii TaxID=1853276 RepID=A0A3N4NF27_9NEIS|nr:phosphoserine phosphatase SerB [Neisseria weixii]RPD90089.1 phosphoserine phosphatase SerB [Neisseria weixii]RPD90337.1 phosphoserine phosphatase SerB [Neisseria weixii]
MPNVLVLQHSDFSRCDLRALHSLKLAEPQYTPHSLRFAVAEDFTLPAATKTELDRQEIDAAVLPDMAFNDLGLIVSDMDSTLITIECIDEIAAGAGLKEQVAEITERTMRGELDFEQSLRSRVALLKGLDEQFLYDVYENVLQLSPGSEYLLAECKKHDVKFLLVSGGFTFFTERLQQRLGFEYQFANVLEITDGKLTGQVLGDVVDAQRKQDLLNEYRDKLGLTASKTLAVGDGANDIPMLETAGIGIAYRAKPKTQLHADACINFGGLERIRGWFR